MTLISKTFQYGQHSVTLETGEIARQADGAVLVNMGDTVVLVTVVAENKAAEGRDFFPMTVDYQEKTYAAGRIPGGFFRREGRPGEKEILTSRLIDRPIRPLFPKGFTNETQIIATVKSLNPEVDPEIPSLLGASAALAVSGLPFQGPIGAARVGYKDGEYLLNQSSTGLSDHTDLDLIVAIDPLFVGALNGVSARTLLENLVVVGLLNGLHDALRVPHGRIDFQFKIGRWWRITGSNR